MEQAWIYLSLLCALSTATSDALTKKALAVHGEYLVAWLRLIFALPLLVLAQFFFPIPRLDSVFFSTFALALPFEVAAFIFYMKALKLSPLSLTLPFLSLTPMFLIIVPSLLLGERISFSGAAGIMLISAGSYTLHIRDFRRGLLEPFRSISKEKGARYMIGVAVMYTFTATFAKTIIEHSSSVFSAFFYYAVLAAVFGPAAYAMDKEGMKKLKTDSSALKSTWLPGLIDAVGMLSVMAALELTAVAYAISLKRLSLLIGVLYGYFMFKETGIRERLAGAGLMLVGFVLIVMYN